MADRLCTIEDCDSPVLARGWCNKHYQRWHRHGDPGTPPTCGQRPADLARWVVENYPDEIREVLG